MVTLLITKETLRPIPYPEPWKPAFIATEIFLICHCFGFVFLFFLEWLMTSFNAKGLEADIF